MSAPAAKAGGKTVLFAPAILEDLENLLPVARALERLSHGAVGAEFVCLDAIYHQNVEKALIAADVAHFVLRPRAAAPVFLLHLPMWRRLAYSLLNHRALSRLARGYDAFVCGAGGVSERIMAAAAWRAGKPTFELQGTLYFRSRITNPGNSLLLALHRAAPALGFLLPGAIIGVTAVMRHLFVMGEHAAATMRTAGVRSEIHAFGIPRYAPLFHPLPALSDERRRTRTVLFLPGAFRWHGYGDLDRFQLATLRELAEVVRALGDDYRVVVKLHPRDYPEDYEPLRASGLVELRAGKLIDSLPDAFLVVGMVSTSLLEAARAGRLTASFMSAEPQGDELWRLTREFPFMPHFRSTAELREYLVRILAPGEQAAEVERQRRGIDAFIAPTTPQAADRIATMILGELEAQAGRGLAPTAAQGAVSAGDPKQ